MTLPEKRRAAKPPGTQTPYCARECKSLYGCENQRALRKCLNQTWRKTSKQEKTSTETARWRATISIRGWLINLAILMQSKLQHPSVNAGTLDQTRWPICSGTAGEDLANPRASVATATAAGSTPVRTGRTCAVFRVGVCAVRKSLRLA